MKCFKLCFLIVVLLASVFSVRPGFAVELGITTFDVPGFEGHTFPLGINARGQIVGQVTDPSTGRNHGFLLDHGVVTIIDFPGASDTGAGAINDRGQIIGVYFIPRDFGFDRHGFLLDHGILTTVDAPGTTGTILRGINDRGQIVDQSSANALLLDHGNVTPVPELADAFGINNRGEIVGDSIQGRGSGVLDNGIFTVIKVPGSIFTRAFGINSRGQVVGFFFSARPQGFLFDDGSFTSINPPGALATEAVGISNSGQIVGAFSDAHGTHGFVASF